MSTQESLREAAAHTLGAEFVAGAAEDPEGFIVALMVNFLTMDIRYTAPSCRTWRCAGERGSGSVRGAA